MAEGSVGTVQATRSGLTRTATWAAYASFAWVAVFIFFHLYWFVGGRLGFGDAPDPIPGTPTSVVGWAFNLLVLAMFVAGLVVPLALARPWGRRIPRWMLLALAWLGCAALAVRGGAGIVDSLLRLAGILPRGLTGLTYEQILGQAYPSAYTLWSGAAIDANFLIGGTLFGLAARRYRSRSRDRQEIGLVAEGLTTTKRKRRSCAISEESRPGAEEA
jgi:Protein of unknown function (DUF3995)